MRNGILATAIGLATLFLFSCQKEKNIEVSSVSITQATAEMYIGETAQLSATVLPSDATEKTVSWTSSKLSVATVSSTGLVTAVAEGTSTITASAGGKSGTCTVTVSKKVIDVSGIELSKTSLELIEGDSETITATVKPDDATDKTVQWSSSDANVATVSEGAITAIKEGTATITAMSGAKSATCNVTVKKKEIPTEDIALNQNLIVLKVGQTETLTATVVPENTTDELTWNSDTPSVASVENGVVTALAEGTAYVYANSGKYSASCQIAVVSATLKAIDMGLSVPWASMNVGASSPEMEGNYYAWGEVEPKNRYTWETYKWGHGGNRQLKKYVNEASEGAVDNITTLVKNDDAAHMVMADKWRMPSKDEMDELLANTVWLVASLGDVPGYLVKSERNGQCIFLPASGIYTNDGLVYKGTSCFLWTSSLYTDWCIKAWYLNASRDYPEYISISENFRSSGAAIRAVYADYPYVPISSVTLDPIRASLKVGKTLDLNLTIEPADATDQEVVWQSSDPTVASVSNGTVTGLKQGNTTIIATVGGIYMTCEVSVWENVPQNATDLGLSVFWAKSNLGSDNPEGTGSFFAWGETSIRESYKWDYYKWGWGGNGSLTKYNYVASYGTLDYKMELEPADDAARFLWGVNWRIPTEAELQELIDNCNWTWTSVNGVNGYEIRSKINGNAIFLPAAGDKYGANYEYYGEKGIYWTSSLCPSSEADPNYAWVVNFRQSYVEKFHHARAMGLTIRPVHVK